MAKWRELEKRLRKLGFIRGESTRHHTIYNCPCKGSPHSVGIENHPNKEAYAYDFKRKLGPHLEEFGKI